MNLEGFNIIEREHMSVTFITVRNRLYSEKRKENGGVLTDADKEWAKKEAAKWYFDRYDVEAPPEGTMAYEKMVCALSAESVMEEMLITEETVSAKALEELWQGLAASEKYIRITQRYETDSFVSLRIVAIDPAKGIYAVVGKVKEKGLETEEVQSYLFVKKTDDFPLGWTREKAWDWIDENGWDVIIDTTDASLEDDCTGEDSCGCKNCYTEKVTIPDGLKDQIEEGMQHTTLFAKAEIVDSPTKEQISGGARALAKANITIDEDELAKQKDLLFVRFKLVHANTNGNLDGFPLEELKKSWKTPVLKNINMEHSNQIIGVMYDSVLREPSEETTSGTVEDPYIETLGVIYKYKFPEVANDIQQRSEVSQLYFSMEVYFSEAECSACGGRYKSVSEYCEHLKERKVVGSQNEGTARILRNIFFSGAGVVKNPADKEAEGLSLAGKSNTKGGLERMPFKTFETEADFNSAVEKALAQYKEELEQKDLIQENDALTQTVSDKDSEIETLQNEKADVEKQFTEYKETVETEKLVATRLGELSEAGLNLEDEERREKVSKLIAGMDDESFATYLDTITPAQADDDDADEDADDDEDAEASDDDEEETTASKKVEDSEEVPTIGGRGLAALDDIMERVAEVTRPNSL